MLGWIVENETVENGFGNSALSLQNEALYISVLRREDAGAG